MKTKYGFVLLIMALDLASCFSTWKDDVGTFSISFGRENRAAFEDVINGLKHTIKISNGLGDEQSINNVKYGQTVKFSVTPGRWHIDVEAWQKTETDVIAVGSNDVNVKPGPNGFIKIDMKWRIPYTITITFEQIKDINLPIDINIVIDKEMNPRKEITLNNPNQYESIEWYINGITGSGPSFILDAGNNAYNSTGPHSLSLTVKKDGITYSQTIAFTVEELE